MKLIEREGVKEKIKTLKKIGYTGVEAIMLIFFIEFKVGISNMIERETGLRQPQVSIETAALRKQGILEVEQVPKQIGRGRPIFLYTALPKEKILALIKKKGDEKLRKENEKLRKEEENLKELRRIIEKYYQE